MSGKKLKLLIIDDEKDICRFEKEYFDRKDFSTYTAQTGGKALALAKKINPDIAIIDIHMKSGINGIEILKRLHKAQAQCQCIMVTWDKERASAAKKLGAVDIVIKPSELATLDKVVNKAVKKLS